MVKKKSHKKFSSTTENPFNVKINRNKHSILGQEVKGTRGVPGVSHSIGNAKRREKFHKKRIRSQKANKFIDKRLQNRSGIYEDSATARFVQERKKRFKKSIFNLNDEESLTHKGIPLVGNNSLKGTEDSEDEEQPLDSQFARQAHFGGFSEESTRKSHKEIMDEVIVESKKRKHETKLAKEINADLIDKLDQEWKEKHTTLPLLKVGIHKEMPEKNDPYDIILQELKFEKRAVPSSPLKTPQEIAREEEDKLKFLEEERNKRMLNPIVNKHANNQLSADSIYDGLDINFEPIEDQVIDNINSSGNEHIVDYGSDESSDVSENEIESNDIIQANVIESHSLSGNFCIIPDSLNKLCNITDDQNEELYIVVENILNKVLKNKTKHNLEKLELFFSILIQYILKKRQEPDKAFDILNSILPHFYMLAEISPVNTAKNLLAFLDEEQNIFQSNKGKRMKKNFPRFQCLVLFKISSAIYSVSDYKHPVVTPAVIFMCDILSSVFVATSQNIFTRLFVCKIMYNCVSYSKRYISEVIWFLNKTLELAINNSKNFNLVTPQVILQQEKININFDISRKKCDDTIKISILSNVIEIIHKYAILYTYLPSFQEIFASFLTICKQLPITNYPPFLKNEIQKLITDIESVKKTYSPLTYENKRPIPLKMLEPAFDSKFNLKKDDIRRKRKLVTNIGQKIRKEERGLLREMRRDNQVFSAEKLKEKLEADEERKRKVKQLYQELAMQEGEYKKFVKKK